MEEEQFHHQDNASQSHPLPPPAESRNPSGFSLLTTCPVTISPAVLPVSIENPIEDLTLGQRNLENNAAAELVRPIALHLNPHGTSMADLNLNLKSAVDPSPLSLKLALTTDPRES